MSLAVRSIPVVLDASKGHLMTNKKKIRTKHSGAPLKHDTKRCTKCQKVKVTSECFYWIQSTQRWASQCKTCIGIGTDEHQQTPKYRAWLKEYLARPEVRERRKVTDRKHYLQRDKGAMKAYRSTPRGKLLHCRQQARYRLKRTTDPTKIKSLESLIAAYTAEIDRMDCRED